MIIAYDSDLENFHEIANAVSVQFVEYYNDIGKMTIVLPIDDYNIAAIQIDGIVYDTERNVSFTIQNIQYDTDKSQIVANGYTCNWLLNRRVLASKKRFANVESAVYSAITNNLRGLPYVDVDIGKGFTEQSESVLYGGQLLAKVIPVMEEAGMGHRMAWNTSTRRHLFTIYKGNDLTQGLHAVSFSEDQGSAPGLVITSDNSVFSNCVYVQGKLADDTEIVEIVGTTNDQLRNEFWMRNQYNQERDETESDFRKRIRSAGKEEIAKRIKRETFKVEISPEEYGSAYSLGDIVSAASQRFGIELSCRIAGVKYTLDTNGEKVELILGEPILTALEEEILKNG